MTTAPSEQTPAVVGPTPDIDSQFYWDGLARSQLLLQECSSCQKRRFPPMPSCPYCGSTDFEIREATKGTIYSWVTVHRAFQPAFAGEVPYTLVTVDLDGGGRIVGRLEPGAAAAAGLHVSPHFVPHEGWTEARFHPE
ncbi:OB-fold domain-containing protein [Acidiferrimicrobium sp. IK]|uniref:Zn-ribbon domain-containing OB-fold protein n=1 Tax=Acidiferrimicrobium sp. IK TaxID=2871700 RepID=UPI0021CB9176|nr:OB-fold domain-containing protein [Acidiferrimicrobium sp. IK]MCU4185935.1 OB-fold domain-containing protein [Acidiferrimicrobium sp. IK]